jgi:SAM-dependent methyltransferase
MADTHPFSNMAASGVHSKALDLAKDYLRGDIKILIAGSGEGGLEYQLLKNDIDASAITALDIDPAQYKISEVACRYCDLNGRIPYDDETFDVCFSIEVIEHLHNPQNIINEIHRVLKPNGMLFLSTPNVHSIAQKLRFLFSDEFHWFRDKHFRGLGHIHPIFDWLLKRMIEKRFELLVYDAPTFQLRLLTKAPGIPMPVKSRLFADINVYSLKKL